MKKIGMLLAVICCTIQLFAQGWFGRQEYYVDSCQLSAGIQTLNNPGYVMAGYRGVRQSGSSSPDFVVYKTDLNGQVIGPNDFFMQYTFSNPCIGGNPRNCSGVSIVESQGNSYNKSYALAAQYDYGIAFGALDAQGNVVQQLFFRFSWV